VGLSPIESARFHGAREFGQALFGNNEQKKRLDKPQHAIRPEQAINGIGIGSQRWSHFEN
jgi:hypothetical protein